MQSHTGHIAEKLEESETAKKAVRELHRSGCASNLTECSKTVKIQEAENQITSLMRPTQPVLDFCQNQRFVCRMAKKLGCQFCAKK